MFYHVNFAMNVVLDPNACDGKNCGDMCTKFTIIQGDQSISEAGFCNEQRICQDDHNPICPSGDESHSFYS